MVFFYLLGVAVAIALLSVIVEDYLVPMVRREAALMRGEARIVWTLPDERKEVLPS